MKENLDGEMEFIRTEAKKKYNAWFFSDSGGRTASQENKVTKMRQLLNISSDGCIGIPAQMDEGWQRRLIGLGGGNSNSGHNCCIGSNTRKVINLVVHSKWCTTCHIYKKKGDVVPAHRCSKNFDHKLSSKSMEAVASVRHKLDIDGGNTGAWIHTLLTDDDSTVRANMLHSYKAIADRDYPGWDQRPGGCGKGGTDWPYQVKTNKKGVTYKAYYKDYGKVPLNLPSVRYFWSDVGHRVKCIAKMIFQLKYKTNKPDKNGEIGLHKCWECLKLKKQAGYFFKGKDNQALPFNEFKAKAHCIYLHHFNDHSCCNESWCKVLKSRRQENPLGLTQTYLAKFRSKVNDAQLFLKVKDDFDYYLTDAMLEQVYHCYSTNKNESLNRRISAVAPKDRYFSGTMSLHDRICNVVITDSVGYKMGLQRILTYVNHSLVLTPVLKEWCKRKDRSMEVKDIHWNKSEVKRRRVEAINSEIRAGTLREAKSKKEGMLYGSGIALTAAAVDDNDEDTADVVLAAATTTPPAEDNSGARIGLVEDHLCSEI